MRLVVGVLRFWRDFLLGDDWRVALGVVASLGLGAALLFGGVRNVWVVPMSVTASLAATLAISLRHEIRQKRRSAPRLQVGEEGDQ